MNKRTVFSLLPIGGKFKFLGNPICFCKTTDFAAHGYINGGSFMVSSIYGEFRTDAIVDTIETIVNIKHGA